MKLSKLQGIVNIHAETGTEGGLWAFQDEKFIDLPSIGERWPKWSYDGLHILDNGDLLTIYSRGREFVLWEGVVSLKPQHRDASSILHVNGIFMRTLPTEQAGVEIFPQWYKLFGEEYPADLQKCPQ